MSLTQMNANPTELELRQFRAGLAIFGLLLGGFWYWRGLSAGGSGAIVGAAAGLALAMQVVPSWRRPIYIGWVRVATLIGTPISYIVVGIVYFGVITPIGLILRAARPSPLTKRFDPAAASYWIPRAPLADRRRYFRQF